MLPDSSKCPDYVPCSYFCSFDWKCSSCVFRYLCNKPGNTVANGETHFSELKTISPSHEISGGSR